MNVQEWNENKLSSVTHVHQDNKNQIQWIGHKQREKILILCLQLHEGAI